MAELKPITDLREIEPGQQLVAVFPEDVQVIRFLSRDLAISEESPFYKQAGYFVELYDRKRAFRLDNYDLSQSKVKLFLGDDEEFVITEKIKIAEKHLHFLQDQLESLKERKSKSA